MSHNLYLLKNVLSKDLRSRVRAIYRIKSAIPSMVKRVPDNIANDGPFDLCIL